MNLTIKNLRGLDAADIAVDKITLVAGLNGAGKSTTAMAMAACLTRNPSPVAGMKQNEARQLLRIGTQRGSATLDGVTVNWPGGSVTGDGHTASPVAAGIESPALMTDKARAVYLIELLKAEPTTDDLTAALGDIPAATLKGIVAMVAADGWDKTHAYAKDRGAKLKGAWEHIAGEAWGAKKAEGWTPADAPELTPEQAADAVTAARQALEAAISDQAVDADTVARLTAEAGDTVDLAPLSARVADADAAASDAEQVLIPATEARNQAVKALQALPAPGIAEQHVPCPGCGAHLVAVSRTELRMAVEPDEAENKKREAAISKAHDAVNKAAEAERAARDEYHRLAGLQGDERAALSEAQQRNARAINAASQLALLRTTGTSSEQIQKARDALDQAEHDLATLSRMAEAAATHQRITDMLRVVDILAPTGLRQTALSRSLGEFNQQVRDLCDLACWYPVEVMPDMSLQVGGLSYHLRSTAEQYRARVALQAVIAKLDGSQALVVDAADVMDIPGRIGLMKVLSATGLPALVTMTYSERDQVPRRKGLDAYWLEGGACVRL